MDMNFLNPDTQDDETLDDFLPEEVELEEYPESYVLIIGAGGQNIYVPVSEDEQTDGLPGVTLQTVLNRGRVLWDQTAQFFVDRTAIGMDFLLTPGTRVGTIGNVKGG